MKSKWTLFAGIALGSVWLAACGDDDDSTTTTDAGADDDDAVDDDSGDDDDDDSDDDDSGDDDADDDDAIADDDATDDDSGDDDVTADDDSDDDDADDDDSDDDDADDDADDDDTDDDDVDPLGIEIGSEGGSFDFGDGIRLVVPPDSIEPSGFVNVEAIAAPSGDVELVSGTWDFAPDGTTFDPPAMLTLPYSATAALDANLAIYFYDEAGSDWVALHDCVTASDSITCPVEHFTVFGVGVTPEADMGEGGAGGEGNSVGGNGGGEAGGAGGAIGGTGGEGLGGTGAGGSGGSEAGSGGATGGTGGIEGSGGAQGGSAGEASGGNGGSASSDCYVPCWDAIDHASCQVGAVESCEVVGTFPNISVNNCYDNGTKVQITSVLVEPLVMSFKKGTGDACYSLEVSGTQTSTYSYTWKTPQGATVMTATVAAANTEVVTYQCNGMEYVIDYSNGACQGEPQPSSPNSSCTMTGSCTF